MNTAQMMLHEFDNKIFRMEEEIERRNTISDYFHSLKDSGRLTYEDIICANSWLDHTTKTADEIIDILERGE